MISIQLFRAGVYASVCLAAVGLWLGDDSVPVPYPWLMIFAAIAAQAFTDTWKKLFIPEPVAPWLGLVIGAIFVAEEFRRYTIDVVQPLGHLLLLMQVLLFFHAKNDFRYWLLLVSSFFQTLIAAVHNNRLSFGVVMVCHLGVALWTLSQFTQLREASRYARGEAAPPRSAWPWRALVGSSVSTFLVLGVAMVFFLVIPRQPQATWAQLQMGSGQQHLSGFDENIRLGQLGTILESDDQVMTIHLEDERGRLYKPSDEPLWRGVALSQYDRGTWQRVTDVTAALKLQTMTRQASFVRQRILLQPIQQGVVFGLRPAFRSEMQNGDPLELAATDGTFLRPDSAPRGQLQYTLDSNVGPFSDQPGEYAPATHRRLDVLRQVPDEISADLKQYVDTIVPPQASSDEVIRLLLEHLRDSGQFSYTLAQSRSDPTIDPVLDFLVNRREGHCEYFASGLALMLRTRGVPARVINGFKGGDWNELLDKFYTVRQKHAHSWVEAIVETPTGSHWVTLDPTPGAARRQVVARVGGTSSFLRQWYDASRQAWFNYVMNYNNQEQQRAVYGPIRRFFTETLAALPRTAWRLARAKFEHFNWLAAWLASGGTALVILVLWLLTQLSRAVSDVLVDKGFAGERRGLRTLARLGTWLRRVFARFGLMDSPRQPRVQFYERLRHILESRHWHKRPTTTPRQFAEEIARSLQASPQSQPVSYHPAGIVDLYYRLRFGRRPLSEIESRLVNQMLRSLEEALVRR